MFKKLVLGFVLAASPVWADLYGPGIDACDFSKTASVVKPVASTLALEVKAILQNNCASCHGPGTSNGGIDNIMSRNNNVRDGLINVADPEKSTMYQVVLTDKMPLAGKKLTKEQKDKILEHIKAGYEDWDSPGPVTPTGFVNYVQLLQCIYQDALAIDVAQQGDAENYEWFLLDNVYNGGTPSQFEDLSFALAGALNKTAANFTLGTANAKTFQPRKVDAAGIIQAVFAPQANKDARKDFDQRLLVNGEYPFAFDRSVGNFLPRETRKIIADLEREITRLTGRVLPYLRADFAVNQIMLKQYYEFLGIDVNRQNAHDIEAVVGVNAAKQIFNLENRALGNKRSGVSNFNRIVHQFRSRYSLGGTFIDSSYWRTYDVKNENVGAKRNLLAFPLGPAGSKFDNFATDNLFEFDAGESIGQLPNGEMFFLVSAANGKLLREADPAIVFDDKRKHPFFGSSPGVIVNGGGCVSCHAGGMNYLVDQVKANASKLNGINADEFNAIHKIYPEQTYWDTAFKTFSTSYQVANASYLPDARTRVQSSEPITATLSTFLDEIPVKAVGPEFGVDEAEILRCLRQLPDNVARALGFSEAGGFVTRDGLNDQFDEIVLACGYGKQILFVNKKPPVVPPPGKTCDYNFKNNSSYRVQFVANWEDPYKGANSVLLFPGENKGFTFASGDAVGKLSDIQYSEKGSGGWGANKPLNGGPISGCRDYELYDNNGKPGIR